MDTWCVVGLDYSTRRIAEKGRRLAVAGIENASVAHLVSLIKNEGKEIQVQDQGVCHNTYSELVVSCMRPLWLGSFQRRHILLHKQRLHQPKCESQVQSQCARG